MAKSKKVHNKTIINVNELNIKQRKFSSSEIGRGVGVQQPAKGKGSYRRKAKYQVSY